VEVPKNLNKIRLSPVWVAVVAISVPVVSLPANGQTAPSSAGTQALKRRPQTAKAIVASSAMLLAQPNGPPTPAQNTQPQPNTTNTPPNGTQQTPPNITPETPPIIRPPGTQNQPQQETPNQIQVPINPGKPPSIQNNIPPAAQPTTPGNAQPGEAPNLQEPKVLVSEVAITTEQGQPLSPELQNQVYRAITTQPGRSTTRSQLQADINSIFATGFFSDVRAVPQDTPLGVRVTFVVQQNPVLRNVQVQANVGTGVPSVLPPGVVQNIFRPQYGTILNLRSFEDGIKQLNKWYQDHGYVLAQVIGAPQVGADGNITLQVAEGVISNIQVHFRNKQGEDTNAKGQPYRPHTRSYIVTRELELKPGTVFNRGTVQTDLQRVYKLGIFEDVRVALNPAPQDPRQVVVVVNVNERTNGSVAAGAGFGSASGLFGTLSYQQQNLFGRNQTIGAEAEVGERDLAFDLRFTDPWIAGDPYRTSYTVDAFRRQEISLVFQGEGPRSHGKEVYLSNGDRPRVVRLGAGVDFTRPLSKNPFKDAEWTLSAGFRYQRVSIRDSNQRIRRTDSQGHNLSFSGTGQDDLTTFQLGAVRDHRNDPLIPTSGSFLRIGDEQSVPIGLGNILLNRVRGSYSKYFPVNITHFKKGPQTLAFNLQAGTILGDLPPYEAFWLGGVDSVRGYGEGDLGTGRSFVQGTVEYRFPVFSIINGALFFDAASDLGTAKSVPGNPAGIRGKPGSGFGYGLGVRVRSPLGAIRIDYGINNLGTSRIEFGIGERF
jgi:outer membrane protein insertion porin family